MNNKVNNKFDNSFAPYNFIPLSNNVLKRYKSIEELPKHNEFTEDTLSGEIEYTIENNTALIVSDGKKKFFKNIDGKYAIPGSTIRGKLRSNITTLGFSEVSSDIENERFLYRRFASKASDLNEEYKVRLGMKTKVIKGGKISVLENVQAGYIRKVSDEEYVIVESKKIKNKTYFRISDEDLKNKIKGLNGIYLLSDKNYERYIKEISFEIDEKNNSIKALGEKNELENNGYILGSGKINKKKSHYIINEIDNNEEVIKISKEDIEAYKKYYRKDKKEELNKNGFYSLPQKNGEEKPVFYVEYNKRVYFGFTQYLRIFYDYSIHDGIPKSHKNGVLDYKKALFGYINENQGYKSRVLVEDAVITNKVKTKDYTMVLQSPKPTCVHLYLKQDRDKISLNSYNNNKFLIRGIKYYWLKEKANPVSVGGNSDSTEEAIEKGGLFKGKIKFNNLYEDELGLLLWALYIDKEANQSIGKGKPYGFGNIKIKDIDVKVENKKDKYNDIFGNSNKKIDIEQYISKYKKYVKNYFPKLKNIEDDVSIKTFIEIHKNKQRNERTEYMMSFNDFAQYKPMSEALEVIGLKTKKIKSNVDEDFNDSPFAKLQGKIK